MDTLAKLFGSASQVKIMRLFLFNPSTSFEESDIRRRASVQTASVRKVTRLLEKVGMIKKKTFYKKKKTKSSGKKKSRKKKKEKVKGWVLDPKFPYLQSLHKLLIGTDPFSHKEIKNKLKESGRIKLLIVSGVFMQQWDSRVDLLVVGDKLKKRKIRKAVRDMETEIGKELSYTFFETNEFIYRINVYDRLIRDVIDHPHEVIIDKIDVANLYPA